MSLLRGFLRNVPPFSQLLVLAGMFVVAWGVLGIAALFLSGYWFGIDEASLLSQNLDSNPSLVSFLKFIQGLNAIVFIVPAFFLSYLVDGKPLEYFTLNKRNSWLSVCIVFTILLTVSPFINWLLELNSLLHLPPSMSAINQWMKNAEEQAKNLTQHFLDIHTVSQFIYTLFIMAILPAIGEELFFRGAVQKVVAQITGNMHSAVFITAIIFSALHIQFYGFLPRVVLGVLLGYFFYWSGSLRLSIWAHGFNNGMVVLFSFLHTKGVISFDPDKVGTGENVELSIIVSLLLTGILMYILYKTENKKKEEALIS